jgi:hypothetical protein
MTEAVRINDADDNTDDFDKVDAGQTLNHDAVGARLAKKLTDHDAGR